MDIGQPAQNALDRLAHIRVQVHRIDDVQIGKILRDPAQRLTDGFKAAAKAFTAMPGYQKHPPPRRQKAETLGELAAQRRVGADHRHDLKQRIDDGISRHRDTLIGHALGQKALARQFRRREMQRGNGADQAAVALFGPGRIKIAGPQPGLDMPDRDPGIIGGKGRRQRRGRIAMHQHHVGGLGLEHRLKALQDRRGDPVQVLAAAHDVQIMVGDDAEKPGDLIQHLAVLGGHADTAFKTRITAKRQNQRRHLDGLGARTENGQNLHG